MNKTLLKTLGVVGAGLVTELAIHSYFDIMARENNYKSLITRISQKMDDSIPDEFEQFNKEKQVWISEQYSERISIDSPREHKLVGYLTYPKADSKCFVLFAHGYHVDHNGDGANFLRYYVERGFNFLAVDHVASGESEGRFVGFGHYECDDCLAWIDYLIDRFGDDIKIIIHGVSMGGATVCQMVSRVPSQVKLAISDCPFTSALEEFDYVAKNAGVKRTKELLVMFNALNKLLAKYDLKDTDVRKSVIYARVPMLFVHGNDDDFIPKEMSRELYDLCPTEKEYFSVDGAKHAESIRIDEAGYHNKLDELIKKYLGE